MMHRGMVICCVIFLICLSAVSVPARASQVTIGTLAYSLVEQGYTNIYIQGSLANRSAWFVDKCDDNSNTVTAWYKRYRKKIAQGPYWFAGLVYIAKGDRKGYSGAVGLGYEYTTRNDITLGGYVGGGAGGDNTVTYGVANLTLGYTFR